MPNLTTEKELNRNLPRVAFFKMEYNLTPERKQQVATEFTRLSPIEWDVPKAEQWPLGDSGPFSGAPENA